MNGIFWKHIFLIEIMHILLFVTYKTKQYIRNDSFIIMQAILMHSFVHYSYTLHQTTS